jgi:hypothetical protein
MSQVNASQKGDSNQPSPSIWSDCPKGLLNDLGLGYFAHEDFLAGAVSATTTGIQTIGGGKLTFVGDTDTVTAQKAAEEGGYLDIETDGDDNDGFALITEPLGKIVRNSGNKFWFEVRLELGAVADQGLFLGLVEEAGATQDVLSDNIASNGVIGESLVGFLVDNGDTNAADAVYKKDAGTIVNVLNDVTNATAIPLADRASLVADTEVKLGLRFDGRDKLHFYANGVKVASQEVDSTFDQAKAYCVIVAGKTGTAAAVSFAFDWIRYGYQSRH